jgi:hypothetical protein
MRWWIVVSLLGACSGRPISQPDETDAISPFDVACSQPLDPSQCDPAKGCFLDLATAKTQTVYCERGGGDAIGAYWVPCDDGHELIDLGYSDWGTTFVYSTRTGQLEAMVGYANSPIMCFEGPPRLDVRGCRLARQMTICMHRRFDLGL